MLRDGKIHSYDANQVKSPMNGNNKYTQKLHQTQFFAGVSDYKKPSLNTLHSGKKGVKPLSGTTDHIENYAISSTHF